MDIPFTITIIIASLAGALLLVGLFAKTELTAQRQVVINSSVDEVFDFIKVLNNHKRFNKWLPIHQGNENFSGSSDYLSMTHEKMWPGPEGRTNLEIVDVYEGHRFLLFHLRAGVLNGPLYMQITTEILSMKKTRLTWAYTGVLVYPFNAFVFIVNSEEGVRRDLEACCHRLKDILETPEKLS